MTYDEQLQDPRWIKLRDYVKKEDRHECRYCGRKEDLQVHHMKYIDGKMAWEYPTELLLTLCRECHEKQHLIGLPRGSESRPILTFREALLEYVEHQTKVLTNG